MCSIEWIQPNSAGSNENTLWYLTRSQWAASASPGGQTSCPLKSSSLNNFPCLCLTVNEDLEAHHPPPATEPPLGGLGTGSAATALTTAVFNLAVVGCICVL